MNLHTSLELAKIFFAGNSEFGGDVQTHYLLVPNIRRRGIEPPKVAMRFAPCFTIFLFQNSLTRLDSWSKPPVFGDLAQRAKKLRLSCNIITYIGVLLDGTMRRLFLAIRRFASLFNDDTRMTDGCWVGEIILGGFINNNTF